MNQTSSNNNTFNSFRPQQSQANNTPFTPQTNNFNRFSGASTFVQQNQQVLEQVYRIDFQGVNLEIKNPSNNYQELELLFSMPIEQAEHIQPQKIIELVDNFLEDLLDQQYRKYSCFMVLDIFEEDFGDPQ